MGRNVLSVTRLSITGLTGNAFSVTPAPPSRAPERTASGLRPCRWEKLDVDELLVEMVDIAKSFPGVRALESAQFELRAGRGPRPGRGERRGEVDPDEDPGRDLPPRCGRHPGPWPGAGDHLPAGGPGPRDQHHPPGAEPDGPPDGCPERVHRPRAAPGTAARREGAQPEDRGAVRGPPHPASIRARACPGSPWRSSRWSRSRKRCPTTRTSWSWTSRPQRSPTPRSTSCSGSPATSASGATGSSTSRTGSKSSSRSPTGSRSCATGATSRPSTRPRHRPRRSSA